MTADLLLPVARDADVHRQLTLLREELCSFDERIQLTFVVRDPAPVVPAVALGELERRRLPELERRRRLDVEVAVDHDGRRVAVPRARGDLAEHELPLAERGHLRLATGTLDEIREPPGSANDVVAVRRIRAHGRDRDELAEFL